LKQLLYSPSAVEKLRQIKQELTVRFDSEMAQNVITKMTQSFRDLQQFENKGLSVEDMMGIPCDYRLLYLQYHYAFYRVEGDRILITDIYNEKEDFMWKLFMVKTTMQETEDYWDED